MPDLARVTTRAASGSGFSGPYFKLRASGFWPGAQRKAPPVRGFLIADDQGRHHGLRAGIGAPKSNAQANNETPAQRF